MDFYSSPPPPLVPRGINGFWSVVAAGSLHLVHTVLVHGAGVDRWWDHWTIGASSDVVRAWMLDGMTKTDVTTIVGRHVHLECSS